MTNNVQPSPLNPTGKTDEIAEAGACEVARQNLVLLEQLLEFVPFQAFWNKFAGGVKEQQRLALNINRSKDERDVAAHIANALEAWFNWPTLQAEALRARIKAFEQRDKAKTAQANAGGTVL